MINKNKMYALVAEMEAVKIRVEGMKAANVERLGRGEALAYGEESFSEEHEELCRIMNELRKL